MCVCVCVYKYVYACVQCVCAWVNSDLLNTISILCINTYYCVCVYVCVCVCVCTCVWCMCVMCVCVCAWMASELLHNIRPVLILILATLPDRKTACLNIYVTQAC